MAAVFAGDDSAADEQPGRERPPVRKVLRPHGRPEGSLTPRLRACIVMTSAVVIEAVNGTIIYAEWRRRIVTRIAGIAVVSAIPVTQPGM